MKLYTANASETTEDWYVWDIYEPQPPKPVFFGTMEDAGLVADALNRTKHSRAGIDKDDRRNQASE